MAAANFKECLLLGVCPHCLPDGIQHLDIGMLDQLEDYSDFMIRRLGDYIKGDYVLVVQSDGFIIHPEYWDPEFLGVDYIGARWPKQPEAFAVGNGGFSLRSRRLLDALKKMDVHMTHPEDVCICIRHREELESQYGIAFASIALANKFSYEESDPGKPTFGFHGIYNIPRVLSKMDLNHYVKLYSGEMLYSSAGRKIIKSLYKHHCYSEARFLLARRMKGPPAIRRDTLMLWMRSLLHQALH